MILGLKCLSNLIVSPILRPSINFDDSLVQKEINTFCANAIICDVIEDYIVNVENQKIIKIDFPVNGNGKHFGYVRVCY